MPERRNRDERHDLRLSISAMPKQQHHPVINMSNNRAGTTSPHDLASRDKTLTPDYSAAASCRAEIA